MLLSKLVFLSVKNVIYLNDPSFNYDGFCAGDFDNDIDYATNINNVFSPLNEAIARLQDLERIPYLVDEVQPSADRIIDLSTLTRKPRRIVGVAVVDRYGNYVKLAFSPFGKNKIRINSAYSTIFNKIFVEYAENIPVFSKNDIVETKIVDDEVVDNNIDLFEQYGIDDAMSNYVMEYVQGKLLEPLAPDLANMHVTRAEAYFNNLSIAKKNFPQQVTQSKYRMGE